MYKFLIKMFGFNKKPKSLTINFFDEKKYLEANKDVQKAIEKGDFKSGLEHLKKVGLNEIKEGKRKFHPDFEPFNENEYLQNNPDVKEAVDKQKFKSGFEHFCLFGYKEIIEGNRPWKLIEKLKNKELKINNEYYFSPIVHTPLISIILVNYNGEEHLEEFFNSLKSQTYKNFEVIFVDNFSKDNSIKKVKEISKTFKQDFKIIENKENLGFAEANNIGLKHAKGELIALVNIDTVLDEKWLEEMFNAMKVDATVSAVTSKTLFYKKFKDVELVSGNEFSISLEEIINNLTYKKFFIRKGILKENVLYSENNKIILSLPVNEKVKISFISKNEEVFYTDKKINNNTYLETIEDNNAKFVINNAGSILKDDFSTADRGYGEYDNGQYNQKAYIDLFCGVSVLIRRSAIVKRELFIPELFGYYEDSELSVWMRKHGFNILYTPTSLVYHKHSSSFNEFSKEREFLIERNKIIYLSAVGKLKKEELEINLETINQKYKNVVKNDFYTLLEKLNNILLKRLGEGKDFYIRRKAIGIYNSFWNTKGGAEKHALEIANILQHYGDVYLISEHNFDIEELEKYFGLNLFNCKKIVESQLREQFTKIFDIFINTTYNSSLVSMCEDSYYIVSFPHKPVSKEFLNSYSFLNNSNFTKSWSDKWWKNYKGSVLYPLGGLNNKNFSYSKKEKIILSVGRFFVEGHNKNQLEIAKAFSKIVKNNKSLKDWKLVLIGGVDFSNKENKAYIDKIIKILKGTNYEVILNADFNKLEEFYKKSYVYVHATGLGRDVNKEPENFEHFGISVVEALIYGCYPLVYGIGGTKEIINYFEVGETFNDEEELKKKLLSCMKDYPKVLVEVEKIRKKIDDYDFENRVREIFFKEKG